MEKAGKRKDNMGKRQKATPVIFSTYTKTMRPATQGAAASTAPGAQGSRTKFQIMSHTAKSKLESEEKDTLCVN